MALKPNETALLDQAISELQDRLTLQVAMMRTATAEVGFERALLAFVRGAERVGMDQQSAIVMLGLAVAALARASSIVEEGQAKSGHRSATD